MIPVLKINLTSLNITFSLHDISQEKFYTKASYFKLKISTARIMSKKMFNYVFNPCTFCSIHNWNWHLLTLEMKKPLTCKVLNAFFSSNKSINLISFAYLKYFCFIENEKKNVSFIFVFKSFPSLYLKWIVINFLRQWIYFWTIFHCLQKCSFSGYDKRFFFVLQQ